MDLTYERGDSSAPKGHALLYFRSAAPGSKPLATYVICLPVAVDLVKYMPPFLAPHIGEMGAQEMSAFAFPPVPEEVDGHGHLEALAQARGDDLLFGGVVDAAQAPSLLGRVNDAVQAYARSYSASIPARVAAGDRGAAEEPSGLEVNEVLYELMGPRDRLAELARLVGKLRFAAEGSDARQVEEAEREVRALARRLPETYRIDALVRAAKVPTPSSGELAGLYLDRCYKLADEDYPRLKEIEERIQALELKTAREQG
jgi:hypothetical protein